MQDINPLLKKHGSQSEYQTQGPGRFLADGPAPMFTPFGLQLFHKPPASGNDQGSMTATNKFPGNLQGATFDPSTLKIRQDLQNCDFPARHTGFLSFHAAKRYAMWGNKVKVFTD